MRRLVLVLCVLWIGSLAAVTRARVDVWLDERALWAAAVDAAPQHPRPRTNLGRAYSLAGDADAALTHYLSAIALSDDPRHSAYLRAFTKAAAASNMATVHIKRGELPEALVLLNRVLEAHPEFPSARYNRGSVWAYLGACDAAAADFAIARRHGERLPEPACR